MRRDFRVPMFAIAGALLGLILLLATLQYRWLGQISGAERERMTATLNTRAAAFAQDFDRELTRAYLLFQLDPMQQDPSPATGLVTRHDRWQATARFPRMIKDVYVVPSSAPVNESSSLQRFNPATRFLEPADWPAAMTEIREQLARSATPVAGSPVGVVMRSMAPAVWPSVPALVIPTPVMMLSHLPGGTGATLSPVSMPEIRHTVLLLDADYIRREMLPALSQQHFQGTGDGFDYQLAVVPTADSGLVYHSVPLFNPKADTPVDAKVELFQVRVKDFEPLVNEVSRFTMFTAATPHGAAIGNRTFIRQSITSRDGSVSIRAQSAPMSIVVQAGRSGDPQATEKLLAGAAAATAAAVARASAPAPHWRLLVKHPSGSLEQAVNVARRRNIIVSTSILGILGVSVGFLILSTRRAQDLARQQLEFVATVSHELRTPLAVIRSAADNLADGVVDDEARVRQYGQLVRHEGLRLTDLVEQILEFAGLQSGQRTMAAGPIDVGTLLGEVIATADGTARAAGVTIELTVADRLPAVAGDEPALRRVFQNLVGNAIKYGVSARWVGVTARPAAGSGVEITVADRGIGIALADQARIFNPFYRAPDVVAAQIQGAGLGLSLVKRIVEAHQGRIHVRSAPAEGSSFIVILPVAHGDGAEGAVGEASPQHS